MNFEYPKTDSIDLRYVLKPVELNGAWYPAKITETGTTEQLKNQPGVATEAQCQKGCDLHNSYFFSNIELQEVLKLSNN